MGLRYRIEPLEALKKKGFTTYSLRQKRLLAETTIQKLRNHKPVGWDNIETLCRLLNCQPGEILEYVPDEAE